MSRALVHIPVLAPKASVECPHGLRALRTPTKVSTDTPSVKATPVDDRTIRVENTDDKLVNVQLRAESTDDSNAVGLELQPGETLDVQVALTRAVEHSKAQADKEGVEVESVGPGRVKVVNTTDTFIRGLTVALES